MRHLRRIEAGLSAVEKTALVLFLSSMVGLSFLQVVLRQVFGTGLLWGDTLSRHMVLWAGFLGAALATAESKHFAWETLVVMMKPATQRWVRLLTIVCGLTITFFLAQASWAFFLDDKAMGSALFTAGNVEVPSWAYSVVYPLGFALIGLHLLIQAVLTLAGQPPPAEGDQHAPSGTEPPEGSGPQSTEEGA